MGFDFARGARELLAGGGAALHVASMWTYLSLSEWETLVDEIVAPVQPVTGAVLELGGGVGAFAASVLARSPDVHEYRCTDVDATVVCACGLMSQDQRLLATQQDMAAPLPYADGQFNTVFIVGSIGYLPDAAAAERAVRSALRVTVPGGRVVVSMVAERTEGLRSLTTLLPESWWRARWPSVVITPHRSKDQDARNIVVLTA